MILFYPILNIHNDKNTNVANHPRCHKFGNADGDVRGTWLHAEVARVA
jgi:hypothetical protein